MNSAKIVIPGDNPPQIQGSPHLERLRNYGEVILHTDRPATPEEQLRRLEGANVLLNSRGHVRWRGDLLRQLPDLRMISVVAIGTDAIDLEAARELGIVVTNVPGKTAFIVAEHALMLMLAAARGAWYYTQRLKSGLWTGRYLTCLHGRTLGLLGAGNIAAATARLGQAIGMKVQAWTFHPSPEREGEMGVRFVDREELLKTSDVVSIHLKLTDQSRGMIGARELALMKPGAILVNTARGAIVDSVALVEALNAGRLGGAGLDVFEKEPLPADHPLLACEQVVLTPHNADQTPEGMDLLNQGAVDNIIAFLEGRPENRVV
jgi:phosphoglycerate dehydrogenase-like enzyme